MHSLGSTIEDAADRASAQSKPTYHDGETLVILQKLGEEGVRDASVMNGACRVCVCSQYPKAASMLKAGLCSGVEEYGGVDLLGRGASGVRA